LDEVYDYQVNNRIDADKVAGYIGDAPHADGKDEPFLVCRFVRVIHAVEEASLRIAGTVALSGSKQTPGYSDYAMRVVERDSENYHDDV